MCPPVHRALPHRALPHRILPSSQRRKLTEPSELTNPLELTRGRRLRLVLQLAATQRVGSCAHKLLFLNQGTTSWRALNTLLPLTDRWERNMALGKSAWRAYLLAQRDGRLKGGSSPSDEDDEGQPVGLEGSRGTSGLRLV